MAIPELSVVVPAFNEAGNIGEFLRRLVPILNDNVESYEIIFAVDPCTDGTEDIILAARAENPHIKMLRFSRRFGQPTAKSYPLGWSRPQNLTRFLRVGGFFAR